MVGWRTSTGAMCSSGGMTTSATCCATAWACSGGQDSSVCHLPAAVLEIPALVSSACCTTASECELPRHAERGHRDQRQGSTARGASRTSSGSSAHLPVSAAAPFQPHQGPLQDQTNCYSMLHCLSTCLDGEAEEARVPQLVHPDLNLQQPKVQWMGMQSPCQSAGRRHANGRHWPQAGHPRIDLQLWQGAAAGRTSPDRAVVADRVAWLQVGCRLPPSQDQCSCLRVSKAHTSAMPGHSPQRTASPGCR